MASVFYPVPETFRGRFRTDTSRRPYPISYPAGPDARSGFAGTNRHAPNPASRHTTAQTPGTPHTPKAKPPVFRQMLNPSDCSPFIHRHPAFPAASTCLPIPQTPRHRNRPDTAPQAKPARFRSRSRQSAHHLRTPDAPIRQTYIPHQKQPPPYRTLLLRHPDSNRLPIGLPAPPFLPLLYSAGPIFRTLHTPTDSRPNRHFPCLSPTVAARILLLFPAAIIVAVCFIS